MCEAGTLWIVDRSEQALRLVQHNLDELPFLWLTAWDNANSLYLKKVCRCQRENHQRIMNGLFHCIQSVLLQYLVAFFRNIVLGWQQMKENTMRRGVKHPGFCRHTLPPQDGAPLRSLWLGAGAVDADTVRQSQRTGIRSDVTIFELWRLFANTISDNISEYQPVTWDNSPNDES